MIYLLFQVKTIKNPGISSGVSVATGYSLSSSANCPRVTNVLWLELHIAKFEGLQLKAIVNRINVFADNEESFIARITNARIFRVGYIVGNREGFANNGG